MEVLNAFRHHRGRHAMLRNGRQVPRWCSTPFGITEVGTHLAIDFQDRRQACSTPFGITEVGTRCAVKAPDNPAVLNAFRHHRGRHGCRSCRDRSISTCSTPFGITEVGTIERSMTTSRSLRHRAQRLSASQRSALPAPNRLPFHRLRHGFSRTLSRPLGRLVQSAWWAVPPHPKHPVLHGLQTVMDPPNCQRAVS